MKLKNKTVLAFTHRYNRIRGNQLTVYDVRLQYGSQICFATLFREKSHALEKISTDMESLEF